MSHLPLAGLRVIDFAVVWAGPFATALLGDLGAEVIKVENPFVLQPMTRGASRHAPPKELLSRFPAMRGGFPNSDPGPRHWNYSPTMVQIFRNKKSFTVDFRQPEGRDILARLVARSDVLVENNATETMEGLGITYDWLKSIRPDIIMLRMPAYGSAGPYANARALGVHLESVMGHTALRGYSRLDPSQNSAIFSGDYIGATQGALAVMMAIWHRKKTGEGQLIELAQAENASGMLYQAFMDYSLNGRLSEATGNRSVQGIAPAGVYPCRSPGTVADGGDRWISIAITNDQEWKALVKEMGSPAWAEQPDYQTNAGRLAAHDEIDNALGGWTKEHDDYDLFHSLQSLGIPCAPVLEVSRAFDDPHVQARGLYEPHELHDNVGTFRYMTPFYRFPDTPSRIVQPPVAFGEHNEYVYKTVLGVSDDEYERLKAAGHIRMDYDDSVL